MAVDSFLHHHLLSSGVVLLEHAEHDVVALGAESPAEDTAVNARALDSDLCAFRSVARLVERRTRGGKSPGSSRFGVQ